MVLLELNEEEINKLNEQKYVLRKSLEKLCDDYDFQNAIRASDKTSVKSRINKIQNMVDELIGGNDIND